MTQIDLLQEQRRIAVQSTAWRKFYQENTRAAHFKVERDDIVATIDAIPYGLRPAYYKARMARLKKRLE